MKNMAKITAVLLVLLIAAAFLTFRTSTLPSKLTDSELRFVGTWCTPTDNKIEFKSNRTFFDGEFSGSWRIENGFIILKTWRDEPHTFGYELANTISKPIVNAWDSILSDEVAWKLDLIDENNARIYTDEWEAWLRPECRQEDLHRFSIVSMARSITTVKTVSFLMTTKQHATNNT